MDVLAQARPEHSVLGEEWASERDGHWSGSVAWKQPTWVIDPIDHTRHFIRRNPEFGTLIALVEGGDTKIGVVSAPALRHRWWAKRGGGAWKDGASMRTSHLRNISEAYVSVAGHVEWVNLQLWDGITTILNSCSYAAGSPGGFLELMKVAEGLTDVFLEPWGKIWDHLAPALIVREAGGRTATLDGRVPFGGSILATNKYLYDDVRSLIHRS